MSGSARCCGWRWWRPAAIGGCLKTQKQQALPWSPRVKRKPQRSQTCRGDDLQRPRVVRPAARPDGVNRRSRVIAAHGLAQPVHRAHFAGTKAPDRAHLQSARDVGGERFGDPSATTRSSTQDLHDDVCGKHHHLDADDHVLLPVEAPGMAGAGANALAQLSAQLHCADLAGCERTKWVMRESLRLFPSLTSIPRKALRACGFGNCQIPKGTPVGLSPIRMPYPRAPTAKLRDGLSIELRELCAPKARACLARPSEGSSQVSDLKPITSLLWPSAEWPAWAEIKRQSGAALEAGTPASACASTRGCWFAAAPLPPSPRSGNIESASAPAAPTG